MNKHKFTYIFEKEFSCWLINREAFQNDNGFKEIASWIEEDVSSTDGYTASAILGGLHLAVEKNKEGIIDCVRGHELFLYDNWVFIQFLHADELAVAIKTDDFIVYLEKYAITEKMRDYKGRTFEFGYDIGGMEAHKLLDKYIEERGF